MTGQPRNLIRNPNFRQIESNSAGFCFFVCSLFVLQLLWVWNSDLVAADTFSYSVSHLSQQIDTQEKQATVKPKKIKLKEIASHVDQNISTVMEVRSVRFSKSKAWCYLESTKKDSKKTKLILVFKTKGRKAFQLAGIEDPTKKFFGKRIRVHGLLTESAKKLQIEILDTKQIKVVGIRPKKTNG